MVAATRMSFTISLPIAAVGILLSVVATVLMVLFCHWKKSLQVCHVVSCRIYEVRVYYQKAFYNMNCYINNVLADVDKNADESTSVDRKLLGFVFPLSF